MSFDFLAALGRDTELTWRSASRGGQYNGPCPWCAGTDRFRVQPNQGSYGWFACNQCGRKGSAIDYLMMKRGMSKREALSLVGWKPKEEGPAAGILPGSALQEPESWQEPPQLWQRAARALYQRCHRILRFASEGRPALDYLHRRGLTSETINTAMLGYHPFDSIGTAKEWGRAVKLPQGIVIPWLTGESLWRLTIRRRVTAGPRRYTQVGGGSNGLYLVDSLQRFSPTVVMTEGELDALSVMQECGSLVSVVATGTTQGSHLPRWVARLAQAPRVLVAFDAEEPGDRAAYWWLERLPNAQRLRPWWKDANQMLQDGAGLGQWVTSAPGYEASIRCSVCGKEVEYYSHQGVPFCEHHWFDHLVERGAYERMLL
jgi:DNA primase